ncbi:GNAT family N-acetyltransferase [Brunnivagina elsteri]|uniref:GNAT family N-acetyltransferase n=1 Tax=Brunnivagina elsteri CCALA 953 TaxID=987040 RepID=A0A2A2TCR3_9CYAN|nr:GNAT family protein [Calothrix elsteri]PAX51540.1 GNAT family N-acetyltransferase [Calothrix elsteri CCALA 953]
MLDKFPQLETKNLILREIKVSDTEAVFNFFSDQDVLKYYDAEPFTNIERARKLINNWNDRFLTRKGIRWGIAKKDENIIIGTCGYRFWGKPLFCAEIGYELTKAYWREGIMSEALAAIIEFAFENTELNRIEATVMLENIASMALLEKLGFIEEGVLREFGFWKDEFHNLKIFSLLKRDYKNSD